MQSDVLTDLMATARGELEPDVIVMSGSIVNVFLGEVECRDMLIKHGRVAGYRDPGTASNNFGGPVVDASGAYVVPGLLDAHYHMGGTHLDVPGLASSLLGCGTTTIATDFYEIYTVAGPEGVRYALDEADRHGLHILYLPPAHLIGLEKVGTFGWDVTADDMVEMLQWRETVGIMEPPAAAVLMGEPDMLRVLDETIRLGKTFAGHAPGQTESSLQAYITTGASSDHESRQPAEALEKLRYGMRPMMRESSAAPDLINLVGLVNAYPASSRFMMLCSDETDPADLVEKGHMDHKIRMVIESGVDPFTAIQMSTINIAEYYGVTASVGSLAPGRRADLVLVDDLESFRPLKTLSAGMVASSDDLPKLASRAPLRPERVNSRINIPRSFAETDFVFPFSGDADSVRVRVFGVVDGSLVSEPRETQLDVRSEQVVSKPDDDVLKIAVAERHRASGRIGKAFVEGFGFREGAVAMTYCHVFHNLLVIGSTDSHMVTAANAVAEMGGGVAVVSSGEVTASWPLSVVGVMGDRPLEVERSAFDEINDALRHIGCDLGSPILSLSFIALPTIPTYGLTDRGLFDVAGQRFVDVVLTTARKE